MDLPKIVAEALTVHCRTGDLFDSIALSRYSYIWRRTPQRASESRSINVSTQITLRLPSYSPDLNAMEEVFPKIEGILFLHKVAPHSREALFEGIGLLPSVQTLPVTYKNPSIAVATAHRATCMMYAVIQRLKKRR